MSKLIPLAVLATAVFSAPLAFAQETGTPAGALAANEATEAAGAVSIGVGVGTAAVIGGIVAAGTDDNEPDAPNDTVTPPGTSPSTSTSTSTSTATGTF